MGTHSEKKPRSRRGRATKSETYRSNESGYQLNFGLKGYYSVRLTYQDRIVYSVRDDELLVVVVRARTHYGD